MCRLARYVLALLIVVLPAERALALEHEWHLGASAGYSYLSFDRAPGRNGFGGQIHARYGLTDAIDLSMSAGATNFFEDGRVLLGTSAGLAYVVDITRWIPTVGAHIGVVDILTTRCELAPALCYHDIRPSVSVPISLEYRALPSFPVGVRFEGQFILLGEPSASISFGAYGAFAL